MKRRQLKFHLRLFILLILSGFPAVFAGYPVRIGEIHSWRPTDQDSLYYFADFSEGFGDWTSVDVTASGAKWHKDDFNAYAGLSWWCGDSITFGYNDEWLEFLISPALDFSNANNPVLTFRMYYALQDTDGAISQTGGEYDGWDGCNVWLSFDDGINWQVLNPANPAYTCQSLKAFGDEWGMGGGISGWSGTSGGWIEAAFDLAIAAGSEAVKIRFTFASDDEISTAQDSLLYGFFIDDISLDDGGLNLLLNNCDNPPFPDEFIFGTGESAGDWWIIDESTFHSSPQCAACDIAGHYILSDAIVSPPIYIPIGYQTHYTFWLWCDMPDWDGDGNNHLDDYYHVEGSLDGIIWEREAFGFYDSGAPSRPGSSGWQEYLPGMAYYGNILMELTSYAGEWVQLRWRIETDSNDDGGVGSGFHLDDFSVWISPGYANDVGAEDMHIPFPTSASNEEVEITVLLTNYGTHNHSGISAFARMDSTNLIPLAPWSYLGVGQTIEKTFTIDCDTITIGEHFWDAYTTFPYDDNRMNDTTRAGYITVTPESVYELGYDSRQYTVPGGTYYYWQFAAGEGALCRFVPADHIIPEGIDVTSAKILFYTEGECVFHLFDAGTATEPGEELHSQPLPVSQTLPQWTTVDLTWIPQLESRAEPFWIWVESLGGGSACITGDGAHFGQGHYFSCEGDSIIPQDDFEFYIRVMAQGNGQAFANSEVDAFPKEFKLYQNYPNPFNPSTVISFELRNASFVNLTIYDLAGREVTKLVDGFQTAGTHSIIFDGSDLASGIYFARLQAGEYVKTQKLLLLK